LLRPRIALRRVREPGGELGVVPRVHELLIDTEVLPARAAVGGDGDPPVPAAGVIARVQQDPLVGELDDRRLIHVLAHGRARCQVSPWSSEKSTYERTTSPPVGPSPAAPGRNQPQYGWRIRPACGPKRSTIPAPEVGKAVRISSGGAAIAVREWNAQERPPSSETPTAEPTTSRSASSVPATASHTPRCCARVWKANSRPLP